MIEELFAKVDTVCGFPPLRTEELAELAARVMEGQSLSLEDAWQLLNIDTTHQPELVDMVLAAARKKKAERFEHAVFSISPLYVTSICREHCIYCNFRVENKSDAITRLRLTPDQLHEEVDFLVNRHGLHVIELVYSSDPHVGVADVAQHIRITADVLDQAGGGIVGINGAPFAKEEYEQLIDAGLNFIVLWQETYDREQYREMHPGRTPKTNYEHRITAYERMIRGGSRTSAWESSPAWRPGGVIGWPSWLTNSTSATPMV